MKSALLILVLFQNLMINGSNDMDKKIYGKWFLVSGMYVDHCGIPSDPGPLNMADSLIVFNSDNTFTTIVQEDQKVYIQNDSGVYSFRDTMVMDSVLTQKWYLKLKNLEYELQFIDEDRVTVIEYGYRMEHYYRLDR